MTEKSFLSGLEEVVARFAGLILTLLFFIIYATSRTTITLDWYGLSAHLIIFWLIYELISYILFIIFRFFSKNNHLTETKVQAPIPEISTPEPITSNQNSENPFLTDKSE
jgi:hypothetical protein